MAVVSSAMRPSSSLTIPDHMELVECKAWSCSATFLREIGAVGRPREYHTEACRAREYRRQIRARKLALKEARQNRWT